MDLILSSIQMFHALKIGQLLWIGMSMKALDFDWNEMSYFIFALRGNKWAYLIYHWNLWCWSCNWAQTCLSSFYTATYWDLCYMALHHTGISCSVALWHINRKTCPFDQPLRTTFNLCNSLVFFLTLSLFSVLKFPFHYSTFPFQTIWVFLLV